MFSTSPHPQTQGASLHPRTTESPWFVMPLVSRSPAQVRQSITDRCAQLVHERDDLDPDGPAYEAKSLQLDAALAALFALGPRDVWGDPD